MSIAKAANMADRANRRQSAIYLTVACASTARRQIAAGAGARLQALGPSTGGGRVATEPPRCGRSGSRRGRRSPRRAPLDVQRRSRSEPNNGDEERDRAARQ